jgi:hypothetical protein
MSEPRADRCETCRFWQAHEDPSQGECRRRSPVLLAGSLGWLDGEDPALGVWPEVRATDWCGQFSPLPIRQKIEGD